MLSLVKWQLVLVVLVKYNNCNLRNGYLSAMIVRG
jgi:K+ transporter